MRNTYRTVRWLHVRSPIVIVNRSITQLCSFLQCLRSFLFWRHRPQLHYVIQCHCFHPLCFRCRWNRFAFTFRAFSRCLCTKPLTINHTYISTLMAVAAMQGANQHIRSNLGFSILPNDTITCRPRDLNQRPKKTLALPLIHRMLPAHLAARQTFLSHICPKSYLRENILDIHVY